MTQEREDDIMRAWRASGSMEHALKFNGFYREADVPQADMAKIWARVQEESVTE